MALGGFVVWGGWKLRFGRDSVKEMDIKHEVGDDGGDV